MTMGTATVAINTGPLPISAPPEFGELYKRYADAVYRAAYRVTGSAADAEDILQSVFLRILTREDRLDATRSPEAYLRRAAINAGIDLIRRKSARPHDPVDERMSAAESSPVLKERLRRAIAELAPRDAELFVLRYVEGLSNGELADMFEIERVTVATRLHRIRQHLQEIL